MNVIYLEQRRRERARKEAERLAQIAAWEIEHGQFG
jgi:hypothetical protein